MAMCPSLGIIDQPVTGERWIGAIAERLTTVPAGRSADVPDAAPVPVSGGCRTVAAPSPEMFGPDSRPRWERLRQSPPAAIPGCGDCLCAMGWSHLGQIDVIVLEADAESSGTGRRFGAGDRPERADRSPIGRANRSRRRATDACCRWARRGCCPLSCGNLIILRLPRPRRAATLPFLLWLLGWCRAVCYHLSFVACMFLAQSGQAQGTAPATHS